MNGITFFFPWETVFIQWLQGFASPLMTAIASFFTMFGEELVLVAIAGFIYWCYDKQWGRDIATILLPTMLAGSLVKNIVLRRRPYMDHSNIQCLKRVDADAPLYDIAAQGYSFPSMHAANTWSIFGSLAIKVRKNWFRVLTGIVLFLIGLSRVFVGVHYPTDILAGWVLGGIIIAMIFLIQRKIHNSLVYLAILGLLALPGWFYCKSNDFFSAYGLMVGIFTGFAVEERFVKFENTRSVLRSILRLIGGIVLFLGLNTLLKLPFSAALLESGSFAAHLIRALRYAIVSFIFICVYPIVFQYTARI